MLVVKVEKEISLAIIEQLAVTFSSGWAVVDSSLTIIDCDAFLESNGCDVEEYVHPDEEDPRER